MKIKQILLILGIFTLNSCLTIENEITLNRNGSGTIKLDYSVSRMFMDLGRVDQDDPIEVLPLSREDFQNTVNKIQGLTLTGWKKETTTERVLIEAELRFSNTDVLSQFYQTSDFSGMEVLADSGLSFQFTRGGQTYGDQALQIINDFFSEERITLIVNTPAPVTSVSSGESSGRRGEFSLSVKDILLSLEPVEWTINW